MNMSVSCGFTQNMTWTKTKLNRKINKANCWIISSFSLCGMRSVYKMVAKVAIIILKFFVLCLEFARKRGVFFSSSRTRWICFSFLFSVDMLQCISTSIVLAMFFLTCYTNLMNRDAFYKFRYSWLSSV